MVGGPGSGKSFISSNRYPELPILDCDKWKASHPDFDPMNPNTLHAWSKVKLMEEFHAMLAEGKSFVYDGTGGNAESYVHRIRMVQALDYDVTVLYVKANLKTALARNRNRGRMVPEAMLREKHSLVATSFEIISGYADHVEVVVND